MQHFPPLPSYLIVLVNLANLAIVEKSIKCSAIILDNGRVV